MANLRIVVPVYNDWVSCSMLLRELDKVAASFPHRIFLTAVNDGSTEDSETGLGDLSSLHNLQGAEILHLSTNVGHQRAIAVGLCVATQDDSADAVLIMDADGEDPPEAIGKITHNLGEKSDFCVVAQRRKRKENATFKISYFFYRLFFKLITGKRIRFGNFSIFSRSYARRLVVISELWNNLPAAVLRSRLKVEEIAVDRGKRYAGRSKMNFTSLVVHGMSGMSVYADTIFTRLLLFTLGMVFFAAIVSVTVIVLRLFFPAHATPGWATSIILGLAIILLQLLFTNLSSILMLLNNRVARLVIPIQDYHPYVASRQMLFGTRFSPLGDTNLLSDQVNSAQ